jgi:hypothetical protein
MERTGVRLQVASVGNFGGRRAAPAVEHLQDCRDRRLLGVARVRLGFALWHECLCYLLWEAH